MRRTPAERLADAAIGVPVAVASAVRRLVPVRTTRLERAVARRLGTITRGTRAGNAAAHRHEPAAEAPTTPARGSAARRDEMLATTPETESAPLRTLPIDGYDQLSARQIVDRLDTLSASDLAAVEAHEREHRRRQTVLSRIAQLS